MYSNNYIAVIFSDNIYGRILLFRKEEAMSRPKLEFVPKTLADLHVDSGLSDHMNGGNFSLHGKTHFTNTPHTARRHSGGLAVSNCSLFSLYFCYAMRLRVLTWLHFDRYTYCICHLYPPPPPPPIPSPPLLQWNHPISNLLYALFSRTNFTTCAYQNESGRSA